MSHSLNTEMELLIRQLNELNEEFKNCFEQNKKFDESKHIFLKIKAANDKLKTHFAEGKDSRMFDEKSE